MARLYVNKSNMPNLTAQVMESDGETKLGGPYRMEPALGSGYWWCNPPERGGDPPVDAKQVADELLAGLIGQASRGLMEQLHD
jgi:hypothetical protein